MLEGKHRLKRLKRDNKLVSCPSIQDSDQTIRCILRGILPGQPLHTVAHYLPNTETIPSDANYSGHHYWLSHSIKAVSLSLQ